MRHLLVLFIFMLLAAPFAEACPEILRGLRSEHLPAELGDLCSTYDRYQAALAKMEKRGLTPAPRAADMHAPRFVGMTKWVKLRDQVHFNPWLIFEPIPTTWEKWEVGAKVVDEMADANLSAKKVAPLSLEWIAYLQGSTLSGLDGLAGRYRDAGEVGLALDVANSLTESQSKALLQIEYPSLLHPEKPLLEWHAVQCWDHHDEAWQNQWNTWFAANRWFNSAFFPDIDTTTYFSNANGEKRQCGYINYADLAEVPTQLGKWMAEINRETSTWGTPAAQGDPILLAAKAQRWFISIHPFRDGNGRTSRFVMELVLRSLGLPSPMLAEFNNDVYTVETAWADEIGQGLLRTVKIAERCADDATDQGCALVSRTYSAAPNVGSKP